MDNWLSGANKEEEATVMVWQASDGMATCSMNLTKWGSNRKDVLDKALFDLTGKSENLFNMKVLGLRWCPEEDCYLFDGLSVEPGLIATKRVVLSLIARLYDPLGFLGPFVLRLKSLFQDVWRLGLDWDAELPDEMGRHVDNWINDLSVMKQWRIPRPYSKGPWRNNQSLEIHGFGNAS